MHIERRIPDDTPNYAGHSHLVEFSLLLGGFFAVVWLLYVVSGAAVSWCVSFVPQKVEGVLFPSATSSSLFPGHGWIANKRNRDLQAILNRLVKASPEITLPLRAHVVDSRITNAFAMPGGLIVVTSTLLERARSENEIAMVLGHEMGHFKLRHHLRGIGRRILMIAFQTLIGVEPEAQSIFIKTSDFMGLSFSREDEQAADEFGLHALQRAYGHVGGAADFFETLAAKEHRIPGMKYTQSHPPSADRLKHLERMSLELGYPKRKTNPKPRSLAR